MLRHDLAADRAIRIGGIHQRGVVGRDHEAKARRKGFDRRGLVRAWARDKARDPAAVRMRLRICQPQSCQSRLRDAGRRARRSRAATGAGARAPAPPHPAVPERLRSSALASRAFAPVGLRRRRATSGAGDEPEPLEPRRDAAPEHRRRASSLRARRGWRRSRRIAKVGSGLISRKTGSPCASRRKSTRAKSRHSSASKAVTASSASRASRAGSSRPGCHRLEHGSGRESAPDLRGRGCRSPIRDRGRAARRAGPTGGALPIRRDRVLGAGDEGLDEGGLSIVDARCATTSRGELCPVRRPGSFGGCPSPFPPSAASRRAGNGAGSDAISTVAVGSAKIGLGRDSESPTAARWRFAQALSRESERVERIGAERRNARHLEQHGSPGLAVSTAEALGEIQDRVDRRLLGRGRGARAGRGVNPGAGGGDPGPGSPTRGPRSSTRVRIPRGHPEDPRGGPDRSQKFHTQRPIESRRMAVRYRPGASRAAGCSEAA